MVEKALDSCPVEVPREGASGFMRLAGARYWTASLLPALVGTTLPFWLRPSGFSFNWPGAIEFFLATALFHVGFSLLQARFEHRSTAKWSEARLLGIAAICIVVACLLGLHLNNQIPGSIFIVYGLGTIFAGLLYVMPPINYCRRAGGEIIIAQSLGLLPVLGAYLVQTGDLTRTVYMVSMPIVIATGLWIWTDQLANREKDQRAGRQTMIDLLGLEFSGRYAVLALTLLFYIMLLMAVYATAISLPGLMALLLLRLVWKIDSVSWNNYASPTHMLAAGKDAFRLHLAICIIITVSSLVGSLW
jgi:1,4-dihydroxy-2-naphthoate octaprenyltransferase